MTLLKKSCSQCSRCSRYTSIFFVPLRTEFFSVSVHAGARMYGVSSGTGNRHTQNYVSPLFFHALSRSRYTGNKQAIKREHDYDQT